jgi:3-hydroxybutyryl-CoA dehydrogenase
VRRASPAGSGGEASAIGVACAVTTGIAPQSVVAVIGAGTMGAGIAQVAAQAGHRVLVFDARPGAAEQARDRIAADLARLAQKGKLDSAVAKATSDRIACAHALGHCAPAALVIEAIVEDMKAKQDLFRDLERIVQDGAIIASNTSSFSITALAASCRRPERVAGMHFFNPAPVLRLVEVVCGLATAPAVAQALYATAQAWGKKPVHAKSTPGFIVNRCARPYYGEALRLLAEGAADPPTLDAVLREAGGFRMGPFELMDLIGIDVNFAVTRSVWEAFFHDPRYTPSCIQQDLVAGGRLGRKTGRGFYEYGDNARPPAPRDEPPRSAPERVTLHGKAGAASALVERMAAAGVAVEQACGHATLGDGAIDVGGAWLAQTDGRTATVRGGEAGVRDLVLFDLALDYAKCTRIAVARADMCSALPSNAVVGALQKAGMAVSVIDDVAGLCVMRTVALLANEAADAVTQAIASAADVDLAMCNGVNYPRGPLAWADAIGPARVREVIGNLARHYGEDRYRISPLLTRRAASGASLLD